MRRVLLLALVLSLEPRVALAQRGTRSGAEAFAIETAGAAAGSLVAAVAGHAILTETRGPCDVEDLSCLLGRLGVLGAVSVVGAAGGAYLAGRGADTDPSGWGSVLGAIVGVGAGAAAVKGLDEIGVRGRWTAALGYAAAQGLVTAAGSRLLSRR
jgi:hypothetical protein